MPMVHRNNQNHQISRNKNGNDNGNDNKEPQYQESSMGIGGLIEKISRSDKTRFQCFFQSKFVIEKLNTNEEVKNTNLSK